MSPRQPKTSGSVDRSWRMRSTLHNQNLPIFAKVALIERPVRIKHVLALVMALLVFHGIAPGQRSILRRVEGSTDNISISPASTSLRASHTLQFTRPVCPVLSQRHFSKRSANSIDKS
jgi:hypothetical protein